MNLVLYNPIYAYRREYCKGSVQFNIEGLYSLKTLHLGSKTDKVYFSIKNLPSLTNLSFYIAATINEDIITRLLDQIPHIQRLCLHGNLSYFNLDNLVNLKHLSLDGFIYTSFNFELFKNLCNRFN